MNNKLNQVSKDLKDSSNMKMAGYVVLHLGATIDGIDTEPVGCLSIDKVKELNDKKKLTVSYNTTTNDAVIRMGILQGDENFKYNKKIIDNKIRLHNGLRYKIIKGNYNGNVNVFKGTPYKYGVSDNLTNFQCAVNNSLNNEQDIQVSVEWCGYIIPSNSGYHTFTMKGGNPTYMWIGQDAHTFYDKLNAFIKPTTVFGKRMFLEKNVPYPIRIQYAQNVSKDEFSLNITHEGKAVNDLFCDGTVGIFPKKEYVFTIKKRPNPQSQYECYYMENSKEFTFNTKCTNLKKLISDPKPEIKPVPSSTQKQPSQPKPDAKTETEYSFFRVFVSDKINKYFLLDINKDSRKLQYIDPTSSIISYGPTYYERNNYSIYSKDKNDLSQYKKVTVSGSTCKQECSKNPKCSHVFEQTHNVDKSITCLMNINGSPVSSYSQVSPSDIYTSKLYIRPPEINMKVEDINVKVQPVIEPTPNERNNNKLEYSLDYTPLSLDNLTLHSKFWKAVKKQKALYLGGEPNKKLTKTVKTEGFDNQYVCSSNMEYTDSSGVIQSIIKHQITPLEKKVDIQQQNIQNVQRNYHNLNKSIDELNKEKSIMNSHNQYKKFNKHGHKPIKHIKDVRNDEIQSHIKANEQMLILGTMAGVSLLIALAMNR